MRASWIFAIIILMLATALATTFMLRDAVNSDACRVAQASCALSLLLLVVFYRNIMKPLRSIANGIDLLRAQDFSSRLAHVGQRESDRIVDLFNGMMTALKNERLHVREQNHFLDLLINVSPTGILILDGDHVTSCNPAAAAFLDTGTGRMPEGTPLSSLASPLAAAIAGIEKGKTETVRLNNSTVYRCSRLSFMDQGYAHPFILIEQLTDEVRKAEKKSYEKVIRVITHEVNNTMAGVNSMLSTAGMMLRAKPEPDTGLAEMMDACENRCKDMSKFITSLAEVVKIPEANLAMHDLNKAIIDWEIMLESICNARKDISLRLDLCGEPLPASFDSVMMERVMINIVKNAAESIGENGEIIISTSPSPPTVTITDNGPGISSETAGKLFSPFFTTKADGQGIGLMLVSETLNRHKCRFSLATGTDGLTRFTISFKQ